jgi:chaperone required for assembly of F1-ATPase
MSRRTIARFYQSVAVNGGGGRYFVVLDAKPLRTPGGNDLVLPTRALAEAIAQEWREQDGRIEPAKMPLTGLAYAAIDFLPARRSEVAEHALSFGRSDLLCYRAADPPELARRQAAAWDPLLEWLREQHGIDLKLGSGLRFVQQSPEALQQLADRVTLFGEFELVVLDRAAGLTGSLVLGLALLEGRLGAAAAFASSHIDEEFQAAIWGRDAEAEARHRHIRLELAAAERFLQLARA